jgi:hypothetical protein
MFDRAGAIDPPVREPTSGVSFHAATLQAETEVYATSFGTTVHDAMAGTARDANVGFLFIGGTHHMLHLAPVAVELNRQSACTVHLFVGAEDERLALERLLVRLGARMPIDVLPTPSWARIIPRFRPGWSSLKLPRLYAGRRRLGAMDVLVTAERTSTMLKRLPGRTPLLVHIPHGAGDRAKGFEQRIKMFDHVIVAGPKDRDRMIAEHVVDPGACSVSGYIKLAGILAMQKRGQGAERLFKNDRQTILYNPHFAPGLSSWPLFGEAVMRNVLDHTDHNLIIAPHVRLRDRLSQADRRRVEAWADDDRLIVDLGSERSMDMTYTLAADIYVGDVSSQVYEFLYRPRPCLFLNAAGEDRRSDPSFAFWKLGEVIDQPEQILAGLGRAIVGHEAVAGLQRKAVHQAFGPIGEQAAANAAAVIIELARASMSPKLIKAA